MSFANAAVLLDLARFISGRAEGATLGDIEARFGCDRRRAQRMLAALRELMPDLARVAEGRRARWRLPAAALAPLAAAPATAPAAPSATRALILAATRALMIGEGYAAVSTRRVGRRAGVSAAAVHYHFPTTDDLLIGLYRETTAQNARRLDAALASTRPLHALWRLSTETGEMGIAIEFMALANHRKGIRAEIASYAEAARARQAAAIAPVLARAALDPALASAAGAVVMLGGLAHALAMEQGVGLRAGQDEARAAIAALLARIEPPDD